VAYKLTVKCKTEGDLLVKGLVGGANSDGRQVATNMRNAGNKFIIPGSSIKGAFKSRAQYICELLNGRNLETKAFGGKDKTSGNIIVKDAIFSLTDNDLIERHRIHVDKFTGGVFNGGLFNERNIYGNFDIEINILKKNDPDFSLALILYVLRDLNAGLFNLGGGFNVGKGFVNIDNIEICSVADAKKYHISFKEDTIDNELTKRALSAFERKMV